MEFSKGLEKAWAEAQASEHNTYTHKAYKVWSNIQAISKHQRK
jgi:hypothetical protein